MDHGEMGSCTKCGEYADLLMRNGLGNWVPTCTACSQEDC